MEHWEEQWELLHPADPDDPDYVPWVAEGEIAESTPTWVRIAVVPSVSQLQTLDAQQRQRTAFVSVQIFTPAGSGTLAANELVDDVRSVLEAQVIASGDERIWTLAASSSPGQSDGAWLMRLVQVPCRWYG